MAYNVYSLPDCRTVLYHPDVGTANLHQSGHGKITISSAGDLTSHTATADGYVVVNKLKSTNGTVTLELPQNSLGDWFLRQWANWQKNSQDILHPKPGFLHDFPADSFLDRFADFRKPRNQRVVPEAALILCDQDPASIDDSDDHCRIDPGINPVSAGRAHHRSFFLQVPAPFEP